VGNRLHLEDDLADLLALPDDLIRRHVQELIDYDGDSAMRQFFVTHPRAALECLVEDIRLYWDRALKHRWSQMIATLEGDVLYRGRLMALEGPEALLPDLHSTISYQDSEIRINASCNHKTIFEVHQLQGEGIQLVPTIFTGCGRAYQVSPNWRPMIVYSARGVGIYNRETRASKPLELALGAGRASVLLALRNPASTGELARRLTVTSGAVSQQLDRLKQAGLVEAHRSGKRVYYRLTQHGEELIALFERMN
jgi:DNA-binding transcriptional ArsR family regulator